MDQANILLVDDEPENILSLEAILDNPTWNLVSANSGEMALKKLLKQEFSVILLDAQLPGMDGFETAQMIRKREKNHDTPIIFITGQYRGIEHISRAYALNAVDYILKPVDPLILQTKVSVLVELQRRTSEVQRKTEQLEQEIVKIKKVETSLRESEGRFRTLVENIPHKVFAKDKHSRYLSCNENYVRDLGIKSEEIIGKTDIDLFPREQASKFLADDKRIMREGIAEDLDEKFDNNGQETWIHTIKTPIRDVTGAISGIMGVSWDVTIQKRLEAEIQSRWQRFLAILDNIPEMLYVTDTETYEVLYVNKALSQVLGFDPVGQQCYEAFYGFDAPCEFCTNQLIRKQEGKPYLWEHHNTKFDKDYMITDQLIHWPDERKVRFEIAIDITERKQQENILHKYYEELEQKNETLERFNRMAVGREHRMIELKKQINQLSEELGRKPPFDLLFVEGQ